MTFLTRDVILRILGFVKANGGRVNRSAITKGLLHKRYNRVIDLSLKHEMGKFIAIEKRKGIKREDWVLLPDGYRMLGASVPNEVKPMPAVPATAISKAQPASVVVHSMARSEPRPEPGLIPRPFSVAPSVRVEQKKMPPNRTDVLECTDGRILYYDGTPAELTPEELTAKRRAGKVSLVHPPPAPGLHWDVLWDCWRA